MADDNKTKELRAQAAELAKLRAMAGELTSVSEINAAVEKEMTGHLQKRLDLMMEVHAGGDNYLENLREQAEAMGTAYFELEKQEGISQSILDTKLKEAQAAADHYKALVEIGVVTEDQIKKDGARLNAQKKISTEAERTAAIVGGAQEGISNVLTMTTMISANWKDTGVGAFFVTAKAEGFGAALGKVKNAMGELFTVGNIVASGVIGLGAALVKMSMSAMNAQSELRKSTGAGEEFDAAILKAGPAAIQAGVGYEGMAKGMIALRKEFTNASDMSAEALAHLGAYAGGLEKIGVSASDTAQRLSFYNDIMGISTEQGKDMDVELLRLSKTLKMDVSDVMKNFGGTMNDMAHHGKDAMKAFVKLQVVSKKTGVDIKSLTSIMKGFNTISGAVANSAKMNVVLGGQFINSAKMMNASEGDRLIMMKKAYEQSGKNFNEMKRHEKQRLADAFGMKDVAEAHRFLTKSTSDDIIKSIASNEKMEASQEELAETIRKTGTPMEQLGQILADLGKIMAPIIAVISGIVGGIKKLSDKIGLFGTVVVIGATLALIGLISRMGAVRSVFSSVGDKIGQVGDFIKDKLGIVSETMEEAGEQGPSFADKIRDIGSAAQENWKGLLALGFAFLMMGAGIAIAAWGVSKFVMAFAGMSVGQILAISVALLVFGLMMAAMAYILVLALPALSGAAIGLLALGAAVVLLGAGIALAAWGMGMMVNGAILPMLDRVGEFIQFAIWFGVFVIAALLMGPAGLSALVGLALMAAGIVILAASLMLIKTKDLVALGNMMMGLGMAASGTGGGMKEAVPIIKSFMHTLLKMAAFIPALIMIFPFLYSLGNSFRAIGQGAAVGAEWLPQFNAALAITFTLLETYGPTLGESNAQLWFLKDNLTGIVALTNPLFMLAIALQSLAAGIFSVGLALMFLDEDKLVQFTYAIENIAVAAPEIEAITDEGIDNVRELGYALNDYGWNFRYAWGWSPDRAMEWADVMTKMGGAMQQLVGVGAPGAKGASGGGGGAAQTVILELDGRELGRTVEALLNGRQKLKSKK